jgi:hypothetical protein
MATKKISKSITKKRSTKAKKAAGAKRSPKKSAGRKAVKR